MDSRDAVTVGWVESGGTRGVNADADSSASTPTRSDHMTVDLYHLLLLSNVHRSDLQACYQPVRKHPRVGRAWARRLASWWMAHRTAASAAPVPGASAAVAALAGAARPEPTSQPSEF